MIHDNLQQKETASSKDSIRVGVCGWDHERWLGTFYPDDLPEDWRLSYYANEFSTVLVAEDEWRSNLGKLEEWADEVPEDFQFYLQSSADELPELMQIRDRLGANFAGIFGVTSSAVMIEFASKSLREWRGWLEQNAAQLDAIFLLDENLSPKQLSEFKSLVEMLNL
jgi:hypothetical protein